MYVIQGWSGNSQEVNMPLGDFQEADFLSLMHATKMNPEAMCPGAGLSRGPSRDSPCPHGALS